MATAENYEYTSAFEAERLVQNLAKFSLSDVGSLKWLNQHETLEQLNVQAHKNLAAQSEEYVSEAFLTHQKIELLIYDLVLISTWKQQVYPGLKRDLIKQNSMAAYFLVFDID